MLRFSGVTATAASEYDVQIPVNAENEFRFSSTLGDFVSTGVADHDQFVSTQDGNPIVRTYDNFTVQSGHTVTTSNRCKGLYLNILGDLVVDGTLSMTARGANAAGKYVIIGNKSRIICYSSTLDPEFDYSKSTVIGPTGGVGANATSAASQFAPAGANNACGAGGGTYGAKGGNGTSFSGGAGAGGYAQYYMNGNVNVAGNAGANNGGAGGAGKIYSTSGADVGIFGGGGAGNPGGTAYKAANNGSNGTGGLMIIFVKGKVVVTGSIQANGSKGGAGSTNGKLRGGPGGGSGGGAIHLIHRKTITGAELITATGGACTNPNNWAYGSSGGNGTVNIVQL